ncbi:hypothetical protein SAMN02745227_00492 [Anaerobranca californiensis DSM 14826]|uniref:Uncharacterized protein n=1 Tax=Anaerobranca californiensis DSM 14826 TaxID=1120989 RepID=A0A1M6LFL1_9FIRM|nr:hypothetical protein [Anaerobranca californiensis]SHJ69984.1 hypothetical protein SAMN02745227_00492 [Anaerobranca californiensis DSM 14826]
MFKYIHLLGRLLIPLSIIFVILFRDNTIIPLITVLLGITFVILAEIKK